MEPLVQISYGGLLGPRRTVRSRWGGEMYHNKTCPAHENKWEVVSLGSSLRHLLWVAGLRRVTFGSP